jgi:hypothetical protein
MPLTFRFASSIALVLVAGCGQAVTSKSVVANRGDDDWHIVFSAQPVCDADDVVRQAMTLEAGSSLNLQPGQSARFYTKIALDSLPSPTWVSCGFAVQTAFRSSQPLAAHLKLKLQRGMATYEYLQSLDENNADNELQYGVCADHSCVRREGALDRMVTPRAVSGSVWFLEVENVGAVEAKGLQAPEFIFAGMR